MRARFALLTLAAGLSLSGCAYGGLGLGVGYGDPYGYGAYGGYDPYYGYGDYGSYGTYGGYGYGSPYYGGYYGSPFGWYNNYYYPGTGYYVYDTYRRPHLWSDAQRRYWSQRIQRSRTTGTTTTVVTRPDWSGFSHRSEAASSDWQSARQQRIQAWQQRQSEREDRADARVRQSSNHRRHDGNRSDDQ